MVIFSTTAQTEKTTKDAQRVINTVIGPLSPFNVLMKEEQDCCQSEVINGFVYSLF